MTAERTKHDDVIYEALAAPAEYARAYNELMAQPTNRLRVRAVAAALKHVTGPVKRVVDIACGGGAYVGAVRQSIGVQPKFVATDRELACVGGYKLNHPAAAGAIGDVTKLPFQSEAFDLAMCYDIIEHIDDDVEFLRGVNRLIRPDGWLVLSTHNSRSLTHALGLMTSAIRGKKWLGWDPTHVRFYNETSLRQKLQRAGFEPKVFTGTYFLPFHLPARLLSWPFEKLGLKRAAKAIYTVVHAPAYLVNYPLEAVCDKAPVRAFGWGIVVVAQKRAAA
jgi:2-polyprenyl-3-methyl-5-hydroxy-6-metoxy-1,4-benzoquinol methylase